MKCCEDVSESCTMQPSRYIISFMMCLVKFVFREFRNCDWHDHVERKELCHLPLESGSPAV